jgi:hypothetical protein
VIPENTTINNQQSLHSNLKNGFSGQSTIDNQQSEP